MPVTQPDGAVSTVASGTFADAIFSADGSRLYAVSGNSVRVISVADGSTLATYSMGTQLGAIDVSPDGLYLAVVELQPAGDTGTLYRIDLSSGEVETFNLPETVALYDVAFLSDGSVMFSQQVSSQLRVVNLDTGAFYTLMDVPPNATLTVSADATYVIAQPHTITWPIYAWDAEIGSGYGILGNPDPYAGASLPPPGSGVGAVSPDGSLVVQGMGLAVHDGAFGTSFSLGQKYPYLINPAALAFSPDGDKLYLLSSAADQVIVFSTSTWDVLAAYPVGADAIHPDDSGAQPDEMMRVSENGQFLSVVTANGIQVMDLDLVVPEAGPGADVLEGSGSLYGFGGDDVLTATGSFANMYGDTGNDTYYVSDDLHQVVEYADEGEDTVHASMTYALGEHVENLVLQGNDSIDGYGHNGDNLLVGNAAANFLSGYDGNDALSGGNGDDTLAGGSGNDRLDGGEGNDTASYEHSWGAVSVNLSVAGVQDTRGAGADSLVSIESVIGSYYDDRLSGNSAANALAGGYGNDVLNGAGGVDTLDGGEGNDIYLISAASHHTAAEIHDSGTWTGNIDEVRFTATGTAQTLAMFAGDTGIERIAISAGLLAHNVDARALLNGVIITGNSGANVLQGSAHADTLRGYAGDDRLYGGEGNDGLDGGAGLDRLYGGLGDDVYVVSDSTDYTYELAGEGYDRVYSSISTRLRDNVERLDLTGSANLTGTGNALDNVIAGNAGYNRLYGVDGDDYLYGYGGNDRLDGGAGIDRMYGGAGNDVYVVSDSTDYAYERAGEGIDSVYASITAVLRANVERLYLTGSQAINGYGNELANVLFGNNAANLIAGRAGNDRIDGEGGDDILFGEDGNDWIEGGSGLDRFYGGSGSDRFVFRDGDLGTSAETADRIHDFSQAERDHVHLAAIDADTTTEGRQGFAFIGIGAFTGTAGELRYDQIGSNTFVQADRDGDGAADFWIRLDGLHTLESDDFIF